MSCIAISFLIMYNPTSPHPTPATLCHYASHNLTLLHLPPSPHRTIRFHYTGNNEMNARAYCSLFGFRGADQQKKVGALSGANATLYLSFRYEMLTIMSLSDFLQCLLLTTFLPSESPSLRTFLSFSVHNYNYLVSSTWPIPVSTSIVIPILFPLCILRWREE
jgi:hypothetical protein